MNLWISNSRIPSSPWSLSNGPEPRKHTFHRVPKTHGRATPQAQFRHAVCNRLDTAMKHQARSHRQPSCSTVTPSTPSCSPQRTHKHFSPRPGPMHMAQRRHSHSNVTPSLVDIDTSRLPGAPVPSVSSQSCFPRCKLASFEAESCQSAHNHYICARKLPLLRLKIYWAERKRPCTETCCTIHERVCQSQPERCQANKVASSEATVLRSCQLHYICITKLPLLRPPSFPATGAHFGRVS